MLSNCICGRGSLACTASLPVPIPPLQVQKAVENAVADGWNAEQQLKQPADPPALLSGLKALPFNLTLLRRARSVWSLLGKHTLLPPACDCCCH